MAQVANTFDTYDSGRNREELSNLISNITPKETPLYSLVGTRKVESIHPEWNRDVYAAPSLTNKAIEGDVYTFAALTATNRLGNYTQISRKDFIVTETQEAVSKAGPKSDYDREMLKKGVELRTDMEVIALSNQASLAGDSATARQTAGLRAWIATNDFMGAGGASGGFNNGTKIVDAATNGTQRAYTKALMDSAISAAYASGGNPTVVMMPPYVKQVFSTFMSDANVAAQRTMTRNKDQMTLYGAADEYIGDFGVYDMVPNRQMARAGATVARNVFFIEPEKVKFGILRPIQEDKDVAKTADALPGVLKVEWCTYVENEAALAVVADVFGLTAAS